MSKKPSQLLRPNSYYSVLRPYFAEVELPKSQSDGYNGNNNSNNATSEAPNNAKAKSIKQANGALHPMRAFNFNVNPLWRHGSLHAHAHNHLHHAPHPPHLRHQHQHQHQHQHHHQHHNQQQQQLMHCQQHEQLQPTHTKQQPAVQQRKWPQKAVEQLARAVAEKQKRSKQKQKHKPTIAEARARVSDSASMIVPVSLDKHQLRWEEEQEQTKAAAADSGAVNQTIMYRSLPIFEVLPPLATNNTQSLVYQNSYLLDGVQYDYGGGRQLQQQLQQQPQDNSSKLKQNYVRFLKSISPHSSPSDRDVVFGNAKVLLTQAHGWEGSRIDWLVELERRHELLRQRHQCGCDASLGEDEPAFDICCFPCNNILFWRGGWLH